MIACTKRPISCALGAVFRSQSLHHCKYDLAICGPYQPPKPIPQVEYELSHHQYCSKDQVLVTSVSTYLILHDAQKATQNLRQTTLIQYMSRGWIGVYCNDIDLEYRGLIAGYLSEQEHI